MLSCLRCRNTVFSGLHPNTFITWLKASINKSRKCSVTPPHAATTRAPPSGRCTDNDLPPLLCFAYTYLQRAEVMLEEFLPPLKECRWGDRLLCPAPHWYVLSHRSNSWNPENRMLYGMWAIMRVLSPTTGHMNTQVQSLNHIIPYGPEERSQLPGSSEKPQSWFCPQLSSADRSLQSPDKILKTYSINPITRLWLIPSQTGQRQPRNSVQT